MTVEEKMADQYDDGIMKGKAEGLQQGIQGTVKILKECGFTDQEITEKIRDEYHLNEKQAEQYFC